MRKMRVGPAVLVFAGVLLAQPATVLAQSGAVSCRSSTTSFERWLDAFKQEATAQGVSGSTLAAAAPYLVYDQSIVNKDRGQRVFAQTYLEFAGRMVAPYRLERGAKLIQTHGATFRRIEQQYGVPAAPIVAFWGLETDFGANIGNLPTLRSLVSLAYDCRRPALFRTQLLAALKIIQRGDLSAEQMIGPWAGELGQLQFLPAHYFDYGVDFDGDGRRDLLKSAPDALGSAGNYLSQIGWRRGEPWLTEVRVPANLRWDQADLAIQHPRAQWAQWGVTLADGRALSADQLPSSLLLPMGRFGPAFLAYNNFKTFLEWNQSLVYSTTAAYYATRLAGAPAMSKGNGPIPQVSFEQVRELQTLLLRAGHKIGEADGKLGLNTRGAIKQAQVKYGLPADSYPSVELIERMRAGR
jgi:lytic murein transglycosylase